MSHFTVMVIGNNPEEQLAPYDEGINMTPYVDGEMSDEDKQRMIDYYKKSGIEYPTFNQLYENKGKDWNNNEWEKRDGVWVRISTYNPKSKWDWYSLGGRWTGFLKLKKGATGQVGQPGVMTNPANEGYVDSALKKDIDFLGMMDDAAKEAGERYDLVMCIVGNTPKVIEWSSFLSRVENNEITIDDARSQYHAQPRVVLLNKNISTLGYIQSPEKYNLSKEEFIDEARNNAISTFAVLKDGEWYEKGEMGWWAVVSNPKDQNEWNGQIKDMIDSLPDDTLISIYDCHI